MALAPDFLRPDADDVDGNWKDSSGGTTLFDKIDEAWVYSGAAVDLGFADSIYFNGTDYADDATALLSCSRASTGYAKNRDGTLTSFATNTLRIGRGTGLLVEDARTNIVTRSQELDHADWTKLNVSVTANAVNAPDGSATADLVIPDATLSFKRISVGTTITVLAVASAMSVYAKAGGYSWISLSRNGTSAVASFNIAAGTLGSVSGTATSAIEALADGWYRCTMYFSATTGIPDNLYIALNAADVSGGVANDNNTGDGVKGIYLWGAQYEQAAFESSYIPTTNAAATRAADSVTVTGALDTALSGSAASFIADVTGAADIDNPIIGAAGQNPILIQGAGFSTTVSSPSPSVSSTIGNSLSYLTGFKAGLAWNSGGRSIVGGGGTVSSDATNIVGARTSSLKLAGNSTGYNGGFVTYRRLTAYNTKLSDATLQGLTDPVDTPYEADYDKAGPVTLGDTDTMRVRLSDPSGTPQEPGYVRFNCQNAGDDDMTLVAVLMEGSTEIARWEEPDIPVTPKTFTEKLTTAQFSAISNFNNLYLKFISAYQWWFDNAVADWDFNDGRYYAPGSIGSASATDMLSCSRASVGYAKTAAGTLTQFSTNTLRITDLGLLIEDARTNCLARSQELSTSPWTVGAVTVTADAGAAPDGTTTADKIVPDATSSTNHRINQTPSTPIANAVPATISCYVKPSGYNYCGLHLTDNVNNYHARFDLTNGTVLSLAGGGAAFDSGIVETLGNGWFRVSATVNSWNGSANPITYIYALPTSSQLIGNAFTGNATDGILAWGAQAEQGAFPSSYIPTTSTSATRAADTISFTGAAKTLLEANSDQSIVVDVLNNNPSLISNNNQNIICDNTANNDSKILFGTSGAQKNVGWLYHTVANQNVQLGSGDLYSPFKAGFSQNISGMSVVGNGGTVGNNANRMPLTNPRLGAKTDSDGFYGYIRRLTLWDTKLPDATLQSLTT